MEEQSRNPDLCAGSTATETFTEHAAGHSFAYELHGCAPEALPKNWNARAARFMSSRRMRSGVSSHRRCSFASSAPHTHESAERGPNATR